MKVDIVTSDDIKIYYTGKFQDFTASYYNKSKSHLKKHDRYGEISVSQTQLVTFYLVLKYPFFLSDWHLDRSYKYK